MSDNPKHENEGSGSVTYPVKSHEPKEWALYTIGVALVAVGLALRFVWFNEWRWGYIGSLIGFLAILWMMSRDRIKLYGDTHDSEETAKEPLRAFARGLKPYMLTIGIPCAILAAIFQIWPGQGASDELTLALSKREKDHVLTVENKRGEKLEINPAQLQRVMDSHGVDIKSNQAAIKALNVAVGGIEYSELLIVNCGAARTEAKCVCPPTHTRVKHATKFDLNAGAAGDGITLCVMTKKYRPPTQ